MWAYLKRENKLNNTFTENGAKTYSTTGSYCLDLFSSVGAIRNNSENDIVNRFIRAFYENDNLAMKLLFFARDIRGGLGERRVFRTILRWLAYNKPEIVEKNLKYIAEYGRYDDLFCLIYTPVQDAMACYVKIQLDKDYEAMIKGENVSLLAKWMPSINTSSSVAVKNGKFFAKSLGLSYANYRKRLSKLRNYIHIVENNLRQKDYSFDYEKLPSRAMYKYRHAFIRNDRSRYFAYLNNVSKGEAKINVSNIMPYEMVEPYLREWQLYFSNNNDVKEEDKIAFNTMWEALPDYVGDENTIAVVDTSGSMYYDQKPMPASVALSLGLYFAQHNKGIFKGKFIEFSKKPELIDIKGDTFFEQFRYIASFNEIANTNIDAVFDLILNAAVKNHIKQEELPKRLIIISDMEFDMCVEGAQISNFERAKRKYESYGYKLPEIVFWNVASRYGHQAVSANEQGVILVSGFSPNIFKMVAEGSCEPYNFMIDVLMSKRYEDISA